MAKRALRVEGVPEFLKAFASARRQIMGAVIGSLEAEKDRVHRNVLSRTPEKTGFLRSQLKAETAPSKFRVRVGWFDAEAFAVRGGFYAPFVEYGRRRPTVVPAARMLGTSFDELLRKWKPPFVQRIKSVIP